MTILTKKANGRWNVVYKGKFLGTVWKSADRGLWVASRCRYKFKTRRQLLNYLTTFHYDY